MDVSEPTLDLSIVLPVYNEAGSLPSLVPELTAVLAQLGRSYEIIAVDDGSSDDSVAVLRRLQEREHRLRIVQFRRNFGQTAAFAAGFDYARGRVVVTMDADLQNDPADIPRLLEKLEEGHDVVSGWRVERWKSAWLTRRLPSVVANRLISETTGVRLHDYGCSLKAYRSEVVKNINLYGELHRFIPAMASWMGVSVAEIPVRYRSRQFGRSKYGMSRTIKVILDLLTVRFLLSYSTRPIHIFGSLGLAMSGVGGILGLYLSVVKLALGQDIGSRPLLLLAVLLMVLGVQMITMGLLGELVVRTYHESQGKRIYVVREILEE